MLYDILSIVLHIFIRPSENILKLSYEVNQLLPFIKNCSFSKLDHFWGFFGANIEFNDLVIDFSRRPPLIHTISIEKYL
jgi:hypothetical protein